MNPRTCDIFCVALIFLAASAWAGRVQLPRSVQQLKNRLRLEDIDDNDYEDFPEMPPLLRYYMPAGAEIRPPKGKRYLGIDIPDYISTSGRSDAIKNIAERMKAMGKRSEA